MAKRSSIVDEVIGNLPVRKPMRWDQRVDPQHKETMEAIRQAYLAGEFGSQQKPAAEAIAKTLRARGIADVQFQGVLDWLKRS